MKKIYLPILAMLLVLSSWQCSKNEANSNSDTTHPPKAAHGIASGQATSLMQPPAAAGGGHLTFTVQMNPVNNNGQLVCNSVLLYVYFPSTYDPANQQIVSIAAAGQNFTYTDNPAGSGSAIGVTAGTFGSPMAIISNTTGHTKVINVTATVNNAEYPGATLQPPQPVGQNDVTGLGMVTYSDNSAARHTAIIIAVDQGITQ